MSDTKESAPATSIAVLDLHLDYLRRDVARLVEAVGHMATRDDIKRLEGQMAQFVTRDELRTLEDRIKGDSMPSTLKRWGDFAKDLAAIVGVLSAIGLAVAKLTGKL